MAEGVGITDSSSATILRDSLCTGDPSSSRRRWFSLLQLIHLQQARRR